MMMRINCRLFSSTSFLRRIILEQQARKLRRIELQKVGSSFRKIDIIAQSERHEEPKQPKLIELRNRAIGIFLPRGYPDSVTANYASFIQWHILTAVTGTVSSILATQSLLLSLGMGASSAIPAAATLNWIIKDGLGLLGGVIYTSVLSGRFDSEPKRFRWFAACFLQLATLCELLTPLVPQYFLLLASASNIGKNIAWLTLSGTRAQMHQTFCLKNNLGDITAKTGSQNTAAGLVGTGLGVGVSALIGGSVTASLAAFVPLSAISMYGVYRSNRNVYTPTLNVQRAEILLKHLFDTQEVLTPEDMSQKEGFMLPYRSIFKKKLVIGSPLLDLDAKTLFSIAEQLETRNYAIAESEKWMKLWFSSNATHEDTLKGFHEACYRRYSGAQNTSKQLDIEALAAKGWHLDQIVFGELYPVSIKTPK